MPPQGPRELLGERLSILIVDAGKPTLESLAREAQNRLAGHAVAAARARNGRPGAPDGKITKQRISDWKTGKPPPKDFDVLKAVLGVLIPEARKRKPKPAVDSLYSVPAWKLWWEAAVGDNQTDTDAERDGNDDSAERICPYRGLAAFDTEYAEFFHGRRKATNALVEKLAESVRTGGVVALVGSSGAGKSSLVRAGLVPTLRGGSALGLSSEGLPVVLLTPGDDPCAQLSDRVPAIKGVLNGAATRRPDTMQDGGARDVDLATTEPEQDPGRSPGAAGEPEEDCFVARTHEAIRAHAEGQGGPGDRLLLIVDQAEELFTLCTDDEQRALYVDILAAACTRRPAGPAPAVVLFVVRADFYQRCMDFPELADALQHRQLLLGPMSTSELREAITGPAHAVGMRLEPGLFELLTRDMGIRVTRSRSRGEVSTYDAGVLPLLSHALRATWQQRKAGKLTIAGYHSARGIQGAVEATAERAWAELDPAGQAAAMQMLVKLTRLSRDTNDTRRRYDKQRLLDQARDAAATERALETLVAARLLTLDAQTVEITHEALLHAWPRLRHRIEKDRAGILVRQELEEDAAEWARARDSALLYRGSRLATARAWGTSESHRDELSPIATAFLNAAMAQKRRSATLRRTAIALLAALSVIASVAAGVAITEANNAAQARDRAIFTQIVAEADQLRTIDTSLAAQLYLAAYRMRPTPTLASQLLDIASDPLSSAVTGHAAIVRSVAYSPDGRTVASSDDDGAVRLWNISDPSHVTPVGSPPGGHERAAHAVAFNRDGHLLATAGGDGAVRLWSVTNPGHPGPAGEPLQLDKPVRAVQFSPTSNLMITGGADGTVRLWDTSAPAHPVAVGAPLRATSDDIRAVAVSGNGQLIAAGGDDGQVRLWNIAEPTRPVPLGGELTQPGVIRAVGFSPDGRTLASAGSGRSVQLWNLTNPAQPAPLGAPVTGFGNTVFSVTFSPDGQTLATASGDNTIRLWNLTNLAAPALLGAPLTGHSRGVVAVAYSPDGQTLVSGGADHTVRVWTLPTVLTGFPGTVSSVAYNPAGTLMAGGGAEGTVLLWDVTAPDRPRLLRLPRANGIGSIDTVAFSPDGKLLAAGGTDHNVWLWDLGNPDAPALIGAPLTGHTGAVYQVAFSPDGRTLASAGADQTVRLWNIRGGAGQPAVTSVAFTPGAPGAPGAARARTPGNGVGAIAFSPDGRTLASGGRDYSVQLWDVTDPRRPALEAAPLGGHTNFVSALAFSPDGRTLVSGSADHTLRRWNVTNPSQPKELGEPLRAQSNSVTSVAYSPDGQMLASGGADHTVQLWSLTDPAQPSHYGAALAGHSDSVRSVAFSPDGRTLVTASRDATVRLWRPNIDAAVARICSTTANTFGPQQWSQYVSTDMTYEPPCADLRRDDRGSATDR